MTPRVRRYVIEAASRNGVDPCAILSPSRQRPVVIARTEVMRRLRWQDRFTTTQIGRWLGRDRTTVSHATRGLI